LPRLTPFTFNGLFPKQKFAPIHIVQDLRTEDVKSSFEIAALSLCSRRT
jgi:hypothetical protein